jgi:hypothetical protein
MERASNPDHDGEQRLSRRRFLRYTTTAGALAAGSPAGAVASAVSAPGQADCCHETRRPGPAPIPRSAFAGFRFPPEVIVVAVRWYLRYGLSYRNVEELLVERGVEVDPVTVYRWVLRFTPLLADAARPCRHAVGARWSRPARPPLRPGSRARRWRVHAGWRDASAVGRLPKPSHNGRTACLFHRFAATSPTSW